MPLLSMQSVSKSFGSSQVIRDLHLEIDDGQLVVLVGTSGCGKTTTLRHIAGLEQPDAGTICFEGKPAVAVAPKDRPVAMVFQSGGYYDHMNVSENLAFVLKSKGMPRSVRGQRVQEIAEMLGIEGLLLRKPAELSGGQLQRLALGRALIRDCKLMLLDEPLSHLDLKLRHRLRDELLEIQTKLGLSMLYVTHDPNEALMMGQRVAILDEGHILQCDTPEKVYHQPASRSVANAVGWPSMHFVKGRLRFQADQFTLDTLGGSWSWSKELIACEWMDSIKRSNTPIVCDVGIRPEDWSIPSTSTDLGGQPSATLPACLSILATVISRRFIGPGWLWKLKTDSNDSIVWLQSCPDEQGLTSRSQRIELSIALAKLKFFDSATGVNLVRMS